MTWITHHIICNIKNYSSRYFCLLFLGMPNCQNQNSLVIIYIVVWTILFRKYLTQLNLLITCKVKFLWKFFSLFHWFIFVFPTKLKIKIRICRYLKINNFYLNFAALFFHYNFWKIIWSFFYQTKKIDKKSYKNYQKLIKNILTNYIVTSPL